MQITFVYQLLEQWRVSTVPKLVCNSIEASDGHPWITLRYKIIDLLELRIKAIGIQRYGFIERHQHKTQPVFIDKELVCLQKMLAILESEVRALTAQDEDHERELHVAFVASVQQRVGILEHTLKTIKTSVSQHQNGNILMSRIGKMIKNTRSEINHHSKHLNDLVLEDVECRAQELILQPIPKCIDHACAPVINQFLAVHSLDADWSSIKTP